jgi:hypothetical protein
LSLEEAFNGSTRLVRSAIGASRSSCRRAWRPAARSASAGRPARATTRAIYI